MDATSHSKSRSPESSRTLRTSSTPIFPFFSFFSFLLAMPPKDTKNLPAKEEALFRTLMVSPFFPSFSYSTQADHFSLRISSLPSPSVPVRAEVVQKGPL